jgi:hypothetical protein
MVHRALITHDQPPIVIHPPAAALHLPTMTVVRSRADRPPTLRTLPESARTRRDGGLDASVAQIAAELPATIGFVRHELFRACPRAASPSWHAHGRQGGRRQLAFMRPGAVHRQPDQQALAIGDNHYLRALADFGLADAGPPVFAGAKLPSRKACVHSTLSWASSWLRSVRQRRSHVPSAVQAWKRRQQVVGEPYVRGTSSHVQPVFSTKRIPFTVRRSSARLRPGPGCCFGISGWMTAHCSSVSSCRLMLPV